jgi:hypothetical protein
VQSSDLHFSRPFVARRAGRRGARSGAPATYSGDRSLWSRLGVGPRMTEPAGWLVLCLAKPVSYTELKCSEDASIAASSLYQVWFSGTKRSRQGHAFPAQRTLDGEIRSIQWFSGKRYPVAISVKCQPCSRPGTEPGCPPGPEGAVCAAVEGA